MAFFPATLAQLRADLKRWIQDQPLQDSITATITAAAVSIPVNDVSQWPVGSTVEIDTEIVFVTTNPGGTGAGSVGVSRGWMGTVAAAHTANTTTFRDPRFLTANYNEALNVVVHDWTSFFFPQLVWDTATGGTYNPIKWIIAAPADALSVERVVCRLPGIFAYEDIPHSQLRMYPPADQIGGVAFSATGNLGFELHDFDGVVMGFPVQVLYGKRWPYLFNDADTVPVDFPEEAQDLVVQGAALYLTGWRMIPKYQNAQVTWAREQNASIPTNQNMVFRRESVNAWAERARQVRARRPTTMMKRMWIGRSG